MSQEAFIESNVSKELVNDGFSQYVAINCARQAVRDWQRSTGAKGSMFKTLMVKARKTAKDMKKAGL